MRAALADRRHSRALVRLAALAALLGLAGPAAADPPAPKGDPLLGAIRGAVARGEIEQTRLRGFDSPARRFTELPRQGAVLIGFDCGLGKFFDTEVIYALRPVYRTAQGEAFFADHGLFHDVHLPRKKVLKSKVLHTVTLRARPGYAVGAVTVRSGLLLNGLSVTYMRVNGLALDPEHSYTSDWVGDRTGGGEGTLDGGGAVVAGVYGSQNDEHVQSLGLLLYNVPPPPIPPAPPPPAPKTERPAAPVPAERPAAPVELPPAAPPPPAARRAEAEPELNAYHDAANHFTFVIPTGWRAMSPAELGRLHDFADSRMSGLHLRYDGGVRRVSGQPWSYPYVLIQVQPMPARGLNYDELERELKGVLPGAIKKASGELGDLVRDASIGSAVLDRDRKIIVLRAKMEVAGAGVVQGLSVCHLGSDAIVSLHCYALDADFEHYLRLFTDMNNSFQFDDGYDFKPAPARSSTLLPTLGYALGIVVFVLIGGSLCLVLVLSRQTRPAAPRADGQGPGRRVRGRRDADADDEEIPWVLPADPDPGITDKPRDRPIPPRRSREDAS